MVLKNLDDVYYIGGKIIKPDYYPKLTRSKIRKSLNSISQNNPKNWACHRILLPRAGCLANGFFRVWIALFWRSYRQVESL